MFEIAVLRPLYTLARKSTVTRIHKYFEERLRLSVRQREERVIFYALGVPKISTPIGRSVSGVKIFSTSSTTVLAEDKSLAQAEDKSTESKHPTSHMSMDFVFPKYFLLF